MTNGKFELNYIDLDVTVAIQIDKLREESKELVDAILNRDLENILEEGMDTIQVVLGIVHTLGLEREFLEYNDKHQKKLRSRGHILNSINIYSEKDKKLIGQELVVKENNRIMRVASGKEINIKAGDKGIINSKGWLTYTTGEARGAITNLDNVKLEGYDHLNIAKVIVNRLNGVYELENFLQDEDIDQREFIGEVQDVLIDIL